MAGNRRRTGGRCFPLGVVSPYSHKNCQGHQNNEKSAGFVHRPIQMQSEALTGEPWNRHEKANEEVLIVAFFQN